jgi:hypothetical protein
MVMPSSLWIRRKRRDLFVADAAGRLVEEEETGLRDEGSRQLDPFLRPKRKRRNRMAGKLLETDELEGFHRTLLGCGFGVECGRQRYSCLEPAAARLDVVADHDVFEHGHRAEQGEVLKRARHSVPEDLVRSHLSDRRTVDCDAARRRSVDARDDVEQGGLARTVGSDEPHHLACLDRE